MSYDETLYARFITGELTEEEIKALKESGDWEILNNIIKSTDQLSLDALDTDAGFEKLKERKSGTSTGKTARLAPRYIWSVAASLLLLVATVFLLMPSETVISAENGSTKTYTLKDASIVKLNDGSSISFKEKNWQNNRKITLSGEAYFEVEKGGDFVISTDNGTVRVLGTSFTVRSRDNALYVECYTGKVRVTQNGQSVELVKNQSVKFSNITKSNIALIDHDSPFWLEGSSQFYDENINAVLNEIARQYDFTIEAPELTNRFSGYFEHDDLEKALQKVCRPVNLNYTIDQSLKIVTISK